MKMTNWEELLREAVIETGEVFEDLQTTLTPEKMKKRFDRDFGETKGEPFTAWGEKYVYFPCEYDGEESVGWAPRNPCDEATKHW